MKSSRFGVFLAMAAMLIIFNNYSAAAEDGLCLQECMAACNDLQRESCDRDCGAFCAAMAPPPETAELAAEEDVSLEDESCFKVCMKECNQGLNLRYCERDCQARCAASSPPQAAVEFTAAELEAEMEAEEAEVETQAEEDGSCFKHCMAECNFYFHCVRDCKKRCKLNTPPPAADFTAVED